MGNWVCLKMGFVFFMSEMVIIHWHWGVHYFHANPLVYHYRHNTCWCPPSRSGCSNDFLLLRSFLRWVEISHQQILTHILFVIFQTCFLLVMMLHHMCYIYVYNFVYIHIMILYKHIQCIYIYGCGCCPSSRTQPRHAPQYAWYRQRADLLPRCELVFAGRWPSLLWESHSGVDLCTMPQLLFQVDHGIFWNLGKRIHKCRSLALSMGARTADRPMGVQCQGISGPHVFSSKTLWLWLL